MSRFETQRARRGLYPTPPEGAQVDVSPPGLAWLPCSDAAAYRVEIEGPGTSYRATALRGPVHCPDQVFGPGDYTWEVVALSPEGRVIARRGIQRFTILEGAQPLPRPSAESLLASIGPGHPRVVYSARVLTEIRATLRTTRSQTWSMIEKAAEEALGHGVPAPPGYDGIADRVEQRLEYKRYHRAFRRAIDGDLTWLSLAYLISEEVRYGHAARRILLQVAAWPFDDGALTSVSCPLGDEPGLSLARVAHRAYDWLYPLLTPAERALVLAMCRARAQQVLRRLIDRHDYLSSPGESHAGRLIAFLVEMAVTMAGEAPEAPRWLDYALDALMTFYPHWAGVDGGWSQGVRYGAHYHTRHLGALETLRRACGLDLWVRPSFRGLRRFFLYCASPRAEMLPFGDGAERDGAAELTTLGGLMRHHAHVFEDGHAGWWAQAASGGSLSPRPESLLFTDEMPIVAPTSEPSSAAFHGIGWAALHSSLSRPDVDTMLLFKCSPFGSASHSHADQGAFAIFHGGRGLAIPSGYYGPRFGMPHHAGWTRTTRANNCVLVDGEGQPTLDSRATGRLVAFTDTSDASYVAGEVTQAYAGRLRSYGRHILFLRPGFFVVVDVLEAHRPAHFQWMMHTFEPMELRPQGVIATRQGSALRVDLRAPGGMEVRQWSGFDPAYNEGAPERFHAVMPEHWNLEARTRQRSAQTRIAAFMDVTGPEESCEAEALVHPGWTGQRVRGRLGTLEGWVCLDPGTPGPEGFGDAVACGDALLCGRTRSGRPIWR